MFDETTTLEEYAEDSAGNWKKFQSYARFWEREDEDNWAVIYTYNTTMSLKAEIDSEFIASALSEFDEDVEIARDSHWLVGYMDGVLIRVFDEDGEITPAFKKLYELQQKALYDHLDETRYYNECYSQTIDNIKFELRYVYEGKEDIQELAEKVYEHMSEHLDVYDDPAYPCAPMAN